MAKNNSANQLVGMMEEWFSKLPALPKKWNEVIVSVTPWIALVFGVLGVGVALTAFGVLAAFSPFIALGSGIGAAGNGIVSSLLFLASSALMLLAFPGTRAHKIGGWNLLFYSELIALVSSVIVFNFGGVIGNLIGFYILFQIKSYYK